MKEKNILLIEDNDYDYDLFENSIENCNYLSNEKINLNRISDGEEAINYIDKNYKNINIIYLDLKLPKITGIEILDHIKNSDNLKHIPVIIFTTSSNYYDVKNCYIKNANSFICKPIRFNDFKNIVKNSLGYWVKINFELNEKES